MGLFFNGGVNEHGILEGTGGDGGGFSPSFAQSSEVLKLAWHVFGRLSGLFLSTKGFVYQINICFGQAFCGT